MLDIDFTFLWTAVNLLILYFVVRFFLFGRLGKYMDERAKSISNSIEEGNALIVEGESAKQEYEKLMADANKKYDELIEEARQKASIEHDEIIKSAKREASGIISSARQRAKQLEERAQSEMRDKAASLALVAASKVIGANMDNQKNRELVDDFIRGEGAA